MDLANHITDLLYRYDCVIVPNFGGFITNRIGTFLDIETNTFYPPTKKISFNGNLKHNDGLLANYIASSEHISFDASNKFIENTVAKWKNHLVNATLEVGSLGSFVLNDQKQLVFEPLAKTNFLTESFGLTGVQANLKEVYQEKTIPIHTADEVVEQTYTSNAGVKGFVKYAATIAILLTLGAVGMKQYNKSQTKSLLVKKQAQMEQRIQEATFVIENPLPTINLNIAREAAKPYHIIAGAFQHESNANKKIDQLYKKGFDAKIVGENSWGLTQVAFESYATKEEAHQALRRIKNAGFSDAWMLIKKQD